MFRASQSWSTRCLTGLLVMALLLSLVPISASAVSSIGLSYSQPSVGRGSLKLYWDSAPNVEFYAYSVRDLTTGESICSNERTSRTSASVSWTWENNHSYRIWAGACCTGNDPDNTSTWDYTGMDSFTVVGCPHTNTETAWDTTNHDVSYKSISDYEHKITGYEYEYCTKCFERIGKSHKVTETQAHVFDSDGDCTICNYLHSCQHKNTELVIASGFPSYKSCNDKEHTCTILYDRVCANATCGKVVKLGDTRTTEDQPHRFNSSGHCKDCGYQKSYEKLQVSVSRSQSEAYAGSSISASASVSGGDGQYKCGWEVTCNGQTVSQTDMGMGAYYSYTASTVGQYVFTVTVTDGQGSRVDASSQSITVKAKPCEHPTYAVQWTADPRSCKSISDSEHTTTGYQYKYCTVCGVQISEKFKATETEPHQFDAAGDCLSCDYRHSCQHKDTTLVIASGFPSYKSCNAKEHTCTTLYDRVCANATCGKVVKLGDTRTTEDQPHRFNSNGRCKDCGYQKSYEKLQLGVSRLKAEAYVGDTIGASASASGGDGQYNYEWQISLNGQVISTFAGGRDDSYSITASSAGQYVFTATVTDGQGSCKTASSSAITVKAKACEHTSYTDVPGTSKYTQISDAKHKKTTLMRRVCDSCKKTLNEYNKEVSESHHFSNGSCKECGAADPNAVCKHKNATNQFAYADITGQGNTQQHIVTDTYKVVCNDCGITIRTYETRRMADHNFNSDGVCSCGYAKPNTCDHANRKTTPLRVTGYVDKGSVGHEKTSLVRVECADCGIVLSAENTVTVVENHDFTYNNTCICGSQHVHDFNEGTRISGPTYSKLDDTQHSVTEVYRKTCKTCGYQTAEIKTRQEKHNLTKFVRMDKYHDPSRKYAHIVIRSCSDCGAEAPYGYDTYKYCTLCFPTPAPTAAETPKPTDAPVPCTLGGEHQWEVHYEVDHPHKAYLQCTVCNEQKETDTVSYLPGKAVNCCDCNGHTLGDVYRDKNTHKYYRRCTSCKVYSIEVTPDPSLKAYYDVMDQQARTKTMSENFPGKSDSKSSSWTHVADKATDTLTNKGFVYTKNGLDAASDKGKTISTAIKDGITGDMWEQQQAEIWEELIRQMLTNEYKQSGNEYDDAVDKLENFSDWCYIVGINDNTAELAGIFERACDSMIEPYMHLASKLPDDKADIVFGQILKIKEQKNTYGNVKNGLELFGETMNVLNIIGSGASAASEMSKKNQEYAAMILDSVNNLDKLDSIIASAKETGNTALYTAALTVKSDFKERMEHNICQYTEGIEAVANVALASAEKGAEIVTSDFLNSSLNLLPGMKELEFAAKVASKVVNWGEAYDSAEELMTLQVMNANMNIYTALEKSDSSTMAELWGYLQVRGCDAANDFLQKYEDANFLSTKDFGIGKKKLKDAQNELDDEKKDYKLFIQKQHSN